MAASFARGAVMSYRSGPGTICSPAGEFERALEMLILEVEANGGDRELKWIGRTIQGFVKSPAFAASKGVRAPMSDEAWTVRAAVVLLCVRGGQKIDF